MTDSDFIYNLWRAEIKYKLLFRDPQKWKQKTKQSTLTGKVANMKLKVSNNLNKIQTATFVPEVGKLETKKIKK